MPVKDLAPTLDARANGDRNDPSQRVAEVQRARMLAAAVQELSERGATNVSVAHIVARSGVSRRTFYELFHDRDECFVAVVDEALASLASVILPAYERQGAWRERMRAALIALLGWVEASRPSARVLLVESPAMGPAALERRNRAIAHVTRAIDAGGQGRDAAPQPLTAEGIAGGALSILQTRLLDTSSSSLLELTGPLMAMIVLPYLGAAAARREGERPMPASAAPPPRRTEQRDAFGNLPIRFTYRTMLVLCAVAERPGASNRLIGQAAEIGDQGQVSKLLARLQRVGLIENTGVGASTRGEPNAWHLTGRGQAVHETIASL
jgi:AcrR family transcriptional regulator